MSEKSTWLDDLAECLRFFSRLPVRARKAGATDYGTAWRAAPFAGAIVGGLGGVALIVLLSLGMAPALASGFALAVLVISTGALHEDGLADVADGFGGGRDRERKLEIMRDSRIGTFGVAAVALSMLLRWAAILAFATGTGVLAASVLIVSGAVSRWLAIAVPRRLPPARPDGLAATTGAIADRPFRQASAVALILALAVTGPVAGFGWTLLALLAAGAALFVVCGLARWQIAGYTGDVIGAAQQVTEIVFLAVLSLSLST